MSIANIRLRVLGLSYSQLKSGAYALILEQTDGPFRIPVVIGAAEAQSIAITLEGITPPRPMTHDLFSSFIQAFGIRPEKVEIYKFEDGIFSSEITFSDGDRTIKLDSRTSDAIAIALRTKIPIYTTQEIIDATGIIIETEHPADTGEYDDDTLSADEEGKRRGPKLENMAVSELKKELQRLIDAELYEEAAKVQAIIDKKNKENQQDDEDNHSIDIGGFTI